KVSLWLATVSKDRPLNFLDHRLKCGNSLVGARLVELRQYPSGSHNDDEPGKTPHLESFIPPYYVETLVTKVKEIEALGEDSREGVKRKGEAYRQLRETAAYRRTRACADAWT